MTRALWVGGLPVPVPDDALTVYADDDEKVAVVAVPTWRVHVITAEGTIEAPRKAGRKLLREFFDA
jgi:hypothetical protein